MKRRLLSALLCLTMVTTLLPAALAAPGEAVVLYTNDVHSYVDQDLTYSRVAALKDSLEGALLVDAGDHIQGTAYGGMDSGATISTLMNASGYDLATLGNHEFDYGMDGCLAAVDRATFPYVSCNFYHEKDGVRGNNVLDSYNILDSNGVKIAFIGITTPETFSSTAPVYFQDKAGRFLYGIAGGADGSALYAALQQAIDEVSSRADYVIALGHLGDDAASGPWTSEAVIAHTVGLDAFIDGHSHSVVAMKQVANAKGESVVLTQTGSYLDFVGKLTIAADGSIRTELLSADDLATLSPDPQVLALEEAWIAEVNGRLGEGIAHADMDFTINGADGNRAVRVAATNLTDFNADAYYWYLNEQEQLPCDLAIVNGGGVRATVPAGNWTYNSCKNVNPFGNVLCLIEVPGQTILDALEFGARDVGLGENGGLLHAAGLTYEVNTAIPSGVQTDGNGSWQDAPEQYRVHNVRIYDRASHQWLPLDPQKTYTVAGSNFTLRHGGDGFSMLSDARLVKDYIVEDYLALAAYARAFADSDGDGLADLCSAGSPLAVYPNYPLNYETPTGSGRMTAAGTPAAEPTPAPDAERYTVVPGDCLWDIARKALGDGRLWAALFDANRDQIRAPHLIYPGQLLRLPGA